MESAYLIHTENKLFCLQHQKKHNMLIIPAIDLKEGQCVRLKQGLMDNSTIFSNDPIATSDRWQSEGCRRLHLVDLDGAITGKPVNKAFVKDIAKRHPHLPIQIGGGIRDFATIESYLDSGIKYVILGTKAIEDPGFIKESCKLFPGHIIISLDAKNNKLATKGWINISEQNIIETALSLQYDGISSCECEREQFCNCYQCS